MPVLDISDGQGNLTRMANIEVFGRMLFPHGGEEHEQFNTWAFIGALAELPEDAYEGPLPKRFLQTIVKAPSYESVVVGIKGARQAAGQAAGAILWFVLSCKHNYPDQKPSLNKAWDVLSIAWSRSNTRKASSVSSLKRSWTEFKTVAHLWAAFEIFASTKLPAGGRDEMQTYGHLLTSREEGNLFLSFLSIADSVARQAGEIVPHGQKKPLLSMHELWVPPADLLERSPSKGVEIVPTALPSDQEEILKSRRAPSRYRHR
jgi:hypothetical protein